MRSSPACVLRKTWRKAFTLVELMAAMAVLGLVLAILAAMVSTVNEAWRDGSGRVDNYTKARLTLELVARDLRNASLRPDLPNFKDAAGASDFAFFASWRGVILDPSSTMARKSDRDLSYVRYTVKTSYDTLSDYLQNGGLQRAAAGFDFNTPLIFDSSIAPPILRMGLIPDGDYQQIGPGVIQWGFRFINRDGSINGFNEWDYDFEHPEKTTNTAAVEICLVVMNEHSLRLLHDVGQLTEVQTQFSAPSDAALSTKSHQELWGEKLLDQGWNIGLPVSARGGIQIFQRRIVLPGGES